MVKHCYGSATSWRADDLRGASDALLYALIDAYARNLNADAAGEKLSDLAVAIRRSHPRAWRYADWVLRGHEMYAVFPECVRQRIQAYYEERQHADNQDSELG